MTSTNRLSKRQRTAEEEIKERQKIADFDIREYPVEVIVQKYNNGKEDDERELFIPDYQREFVWDETRQSRFIESILINLPIPYLFVADSEEKDGRLEIIDGTQRIRTLDHFVNSGLKLSGLKFLPSLNGLTFQDFPVSRQRRFLRQTLRMIEMTDSLDEEGRREIFDRLNSGSEVLTPMEQRTGSKDGPFLDFLRKMAGNPLFKELCPVSETRIKRQEYLELVLRYFAYVERYKEFKKSVTDFLDDYLCEMNEANPNTDVYERQFCNMLGFVKENFPYGFQKSPSNQSVPRIRFEALSVGITLALKQDPSLQCPDLDWINENNESGKKFKQLTRSDASNSKPRVVERIEYVRNKFLHLGE